MSAPDNPLPALIQGFFHHLLVQQQGASRHTVSSCRDTLRQLLNFVHRRSGTTPSSVTFEQIDAPSILAFLDEVEIKRGNSPRTRNLRLTAIRSLMRYACLKEPTVSPVAQRVLAIPSKRVDRPVLGFLTREEIQTVLDAPDLDTWNGRRDALMWILLYNTGARVSELTRLNVEDVQVERTTSLRLHGKGRKQRVLPLWKQTSAQLRRWLSELPSTPTTPVFTNLRGNRLSSSGVAHRLRLSVKAASLKCPKLKTRVVSPHTLRHTNAMHLLQAGVDITVIALWLGHEDISTTHQYIEADLAMKEKALSRIDEPDLPTNRFEPKDELLAFLEGL